MKTKWIFILAMLLAVGCADGDSGSTTTPVVGFNVGNLAPEIEGEELTGTSMKLSDYRGKIVLLDFWGDW